MITAFIRAWLAPDQLELSQQIRRKRIAVDMAYVAVKRAYFQVDIVKLGRLIKEHRKLCDEWSAMAKEYEERFL